LRSIMSSKKKDLLIMTTPVGKDEDDTMKTSKFETIMDPEEDIVVKDKDDSKNDDMKENSANEKVNNANPSTMKPRRSIRNECPRIKGLQSKGNFFNKALHYKIHLPSLKTEIYRQYSDFEWLHKKLLDRYGSISGSFIPALPNKISLKGINKEQISEHCKLLQEWIIDIFKHSNLYNDESTVYFLSTHQNQNFSKMRKSFIEQSDIDKIRKENELDGDNNNNNDKRKSSKSNRISHVQLKSQESNNHLQPL